MEVERYLASKIIFELFFKIIENWVEVFICQQRVKWPLEERQLIEELFTW